MIGAAQVKQKLEEYNKKIQEPKRRNSTGIMNVLVYLRQSRKQEELLKHIMRKVHVNREMAWNYIQNMKRDELIIKSLDTRPIRRPSAIYILNHTKINALLKETSKQIETMNTEDFLNCLPNHI